MVIKGILKALFPFLCFPWLLNFSDLPNFGSNSRKRYTLRLLSKCLVRSTFLSIGGFDHISVSWEITVLYFFGWNFLRYWQKCKASDLPLLALKFTKIVMSFLKPRVSFSSNFASLFNVMRNNSSVLFHIKLYILSTKGTNQVQILRLSTACVKINQIPCHFSSHESVFTYICITFQCHDSCNITLWTKRSHQNTNFQIFECFNETSLNSSCQFWNHKVKVYSNFASLFSVMKDNSTVFF